MDNKEYSKVYKTFNYTQFQMMRGNRIVNHANVSFIEKSMVEKQLIIPIIVNDNFEIIDGQHRFLACRKLGLPVYYIINEGYTIDDVIRANVNGGLKWYNKDYLDRYVALENPVYLTIRDFCVENLITATDYIKLTSLIKDENSNITKTDFREGKFGLEQHMRMTDFIEKLNIFNRFVGYKTTSFMTAFMKLYLREDYDHNSMITKFNLYCNNLIFQRTINEYLGVLCNRIYSAGQTKNPIYFIAETSRFHK